MTEHERYIAAIDRADIVKVLGRYLPLHRAPKRFDHDKERYLGACPINEKPSSEEWLFCRPDEVMVVYPSSKHWKCLCCGCDGNALDVILRREDLSFADALERLEQMIKEDEEK
jgi:DNA primase